MSDVSRRVGALERAAGVSTGGAWCECPGDDVRVVVVWTDDEILAAEAADAEPVVCERCGRPVRVRRLVVEYPDVAEVLDES